MLYNLVMCSTYNNKIIDIECGLDGRPLRFVDKSHAEREAYEKNCLMISETGQNSPLYWRVEEEKND